jgi:hypothetical protein
MIKEEKKKKKPSKNIIKNKFFNDKTIINSEPEFEL